MIASQPHRPARSTLDVDAFPAPCVAGTSGPASATASATVSWTKIPKQPDRHERQERRLIDLVGIQGRISSLRD